MIVFTTKFRIARRMIVFITNSPVIQMSKGVEGLPDTIGPTSELITESIKRLSARDTPTTGTEPVSEDERPARTHKQKHHKKPKSDDYSDYDRYGYYYYDDDEQDAGDYDYPEEEDGYEEDRLDVRLDRPFSEVIKGVSADPTFGMTAAPNPATVAEDAGPRRRKRDEEQEPEVTYTDEQLEDAVNQFKKKKTVPPFLMRNAVLDYLRRQGVKHIIAEEYDAARKIDLLVDDLIQAAMKDAGGFRNEEEAKNLETRFEKAQHRKTSSSQMYEERLAQLQAQEQQKIDKLLEYQEFERKQFEADCQKPEFLQKFSKPSPQLLQVRRRQKTLALAHEFDQAKALKTEGERLQREETLKGQERAMERIRALYEQLLTKQHHQLWCAQTNAERKLQVLKDEMTKEKEVHNYVTRRLESQLKETRSRKATLPPLRSSGTTLPQSKNARTQLLKYKADPEIKQLDIKLTNIKSVMTMRPPARPVNLLATTK